MNQPGCPIPRRQFLHAASLGAAGLVLGQSGCRSAGSGTARTRIAFNTANLVGRYTGYLGWYSWEDEPEDRNPLESAVRNRRWQEARLS